MVEHVTEKFQHIYFKNFAENCIKFIEKYTKTLFCNIQMASSR